MKPAVSPARNRNDPSETKALVRARLYTTARGSGGLHARRS